MQNIGAMKVEWPLLSKNKRQYIAVSEASLPLLLPNKSYAILRRFSAKEAQRRIVAAPYLAGQIPSPFLGFENHLNFVHRPNGTLSSEEAFGLAALFNSALLDVYFRSLNGNTQVGAGEVRAMQLPPLASIVALGRLVMSGPSGDDLDAAVEQILVR